MTNPMRAAGVALVLTLAFVAWAAPVPQTTPVKFAFVDGSALLNAAPGRTKAEQMFAQEKAGFEKTVAAWSDSLKALQKKYQDEEPGLSPAAKTTRQAELNQKYDYFQQKNDSLTQIASKRQQDLLQPMIDLVNKVLNDFRTSEGYTAILDLSAQGNPVVSYDKNLDMTNELLAKVKAQPAPKLPDAATAAKKPPPSP